MYYFPVEYRNDAYKGRIKRKDKAFSISQNYESFIEAMVSSTVNQVSICIAYKIPISKP